MAKPRKRHVQQAFAFKTHGGHRDNAGRPRSGKYASEPHKKRSSFRASEPLHVNIRVEREVGRLRHGHMYKAIRSATIRAAQRGDFRIVHLSIQHNHLHLIVEAHGPTALAKGMQGFQISAAKHLNAAMSKQRGGERRRGRVFCDRYHARALRSPREVRHAIAYVLNNWRRHREDRVTTTRTWHADPYSTGHAFDGWKELIETNRRFGPPSPTYESLAAWSPRTWLLHTGWRRAGLISLYEVPGPLPRR